MKTTLFLQQNLPFSNSPVSAELENEKILCNDIQLPHDSRHPHNMRLWVLGNEYGPMGAVWASCEGDAIDELIDNDLAGGILIEEEDIDEEDEENVPRGGNDGEPYDSSYLWMAPVIFEPTRDWETIAKFAEARGASYRDLSDV